MRRTKKIEGFMRECDYCTKRVWGFKNLVILVQVGNVGIGKLWGCVGVAPDLALECKVCW